MLKAWDVQKGVSKVLAQRGCKNCKWRSDDFTSVCVNDASDHLADYVMADDVCECWEGKLPDKSDIIYGLECLRTNEGDCNSCIWNGRGSCLNAIATDALELLREDKDD